MTRLAIILIFIPLFLAVSHSHAGPVVKVGARVLQESGYSQINGKRVGLITNHTAVVDRTHLIDLIHAGGKARVAALFAPEHGLRGLKEDGIEIAQSVDALTGAPVFSLYGTVKKPTPAMLRNLDLIIFDIQDIGARFYTYISTMGLGMQAAAEARIPFIVLDRPNPLGGDYFAGPILEPGFRSFVGEYPVPVTHGLTVGELALMIKGEGMLPGLEHLDLRVIRMEGWQRRMQWPDTGLEWVKTSPNIPDFETALLYPGICFVEGTVASAGRGTLEPFKLVGYPGIDAGEIAGDLNDAKLPGVRFVPVSYTPRSLPGASNAPKYRDRKIPGLRLIITDAHAYRPVETGIHLISVLYETLGTVERNRFFKKAGFDRLAGTGFLRQEIESGKDPAEIIAGWSRETKLFAERRSKYLLY